MFHALLLLGKTITITCYLDRDNAFEFPLYYIMGTNVDKEAYRRVLIDVLFEKSFADQIHICVTSIY